MILVDSDSSARVKTVRAVLERLRTPNLNLSTSKVSDGAKDAVSQGTSISAAGVRADLQVSRRP